MLESTIKTHIEARIAEAWPGIDPDQVIVRFPGGDLSLTRNKSRHCIGSEILAVEIIVHTDSRPDRVALIRAFPFGSFLFGDVTAIQKYTRHRYYDLVELAAGKRSIFYLTYTYDIFEE